MSFQEVCDECGRHVAVAGHDPDCSEANGNESGEQSATGTEQSRGGEGNE